VTLPERFPTYDQIRRLAALDNVSLSGCEIADAKQQLGYHVRMSQNRKDPHFRSKRIENWKLEMIRQILWDLHL